MDRPTSDTYNFVGRSRCGNCMQFNVVTKDVSIKKGVTVENHLKGYPCDNCGVIGKVKKV